MKSVIIVLSILVVVCFVQGQHLISKGVDRLKDDVTARGEAIKSVGAEVVDSVVGKN